MKNSARLWMRSFVVLGSWGVVLGGGGVGCSSSAEDAQLTVDAGPAAVPLAERYRVDDVSIYQAVKVPLLQKGEVVPTRNAPIVVGRPAVVRVGFVRAPTFGEPISAQGELRIVNPGKADKIVTAQLDSTSSVWWDERMESTLNFSLAAEDVTEQTSIAVKVTSADTGVQSLSFPADGTPLALGAKSTVQNLKVRLVPISYESDGSGRLPDLSDPSSYHDAIYGMYPVPKVELTVRAPFRWQSDVQPDGSGWDDLLTGLMQLRRADKVDPDVYYVGVFNPRDTRRQFCERGGCVLGVAPASDGTEVGLRVSLVLGYETSMSDGTLVQELAHSMGRLHAPCGKPAAIDRKYPYKDGTVGVPGLDIVQMIPKEPSHADFMSYCTPTWVSDYTFAGIHERLGLVREQTARIAAENDKTPGAEEVPGTGIGSTVLRDAFSLYVAPDGAVHPGPRIQTIGTSTSEDDETLDVALQDGAGHVTGHVTGRVRSFDPTGGRLVVLPVASERSLLSAARLHVEKLGARAVVSMAAMKAAR